MTSDSAKPDPQHPVPRVSFGSDEQETTETRQDEQDRELQQENAETSLDQPSQ